MAVHTITVEPTGQQFLCPDTKNVLVAMEYLGLHWHHFGLPILPPVIAEHKIKAPEKNKIVVYMGFEDVGEIIRWLHMPDPTLPVGDTPLAGDQGSRQGPRLFGQ